MSHMNGSLAGLVAGRRRHRPERTSTASYQVQPLALIADGAADGVHYGFPGLAVLPDGSFCAVCRRGLDHNPTSDPATFGKLVVSRSTDAGATWTAPTVIYEDANYDLRDPTLSLLSDGRLALLYFRYHPDAKNDTVTYVSYSDDGGVTWTTPEALPFSGAFWTACSGPMVETTPGNLFAFGYGYVSGLRWVSSDDNGATWSSGIALSDFAPGTQEPYAGVRPDGLIEVHLRTYTDNERTPPNVRYRSIRMSDSSWAPPEPFANNMNGRPSWAVNPQTGHRLSIDRNSAHYWNISETLNDRLGNWTRLGQLRTSQYAQPVAYGSGFLAVVAAAEVLNERSSLFWTRWDLT